MSKGNETAFILKIQRWLRDHFYDLVLMLIVSAFGLGMGLWARAVILDDAMITFRVAENLAYGRGFVYNPGEYVQVTTTPLYTMLLAGGSWLLGSLGMFFWLVCFVMGRMTAYL